MTFFISYQVYVICLYNIINYYFIILLLINKRDSDLKENNCSIIHTILRKTRPFVKKTIIIIQQSLLIGFSSMVLIFLHTIKKGLRQKTSPFHIHIMYFYMHMWFIVQRSRVQIRSMMWYTRVAGKLCSICFYLNRTNIRHGTRNSLGNYAYVFILFSNS